MLRSTRYGPGFDEPLPKACRQGRSTPPTAARPITMTLRTICEAWRESLAAHRQYEKLRARSIPHETAIREALGFGRSASRPARENAERLYFSGKA
jgi:hypothetical protein